MGGGYVTLTLQSQHTERQGDYDRLRKLAESMDKSTAAFMDSYLLTAPVDGTGKPHRPLSLDDPTLTTRRKTIETNIQEQDEALEEIAPAFDKPDTELLNRYRDKMIAARDQLEDLKPAEDGHDLMQAIENARDARVDVLNLLQRRAHRFITNPFSAKP